jgi:molybdopterin synthase catalytic subunit
MTDRVVVASVSESSISVDDCVGRLGADDEGAIVSFAGIVRDHDAGRSVVLLEYEAHPTAGEAIASVASSVAGRHPEVRIAVMHRTGSLAVGDIALAAAVASVHRAAAFAACAELIDEVKRSVPIWKRQHFADGTSEWVGSLD